MIILIKWNLNWNRLRSLRLPSSRSTCSQDLKASSWEINIDKDQRVAVTLQSATSVPKGQKRVKVQTDRPVRKKRSRRRGREAMMWLQRRPKLIQRHVLRITVMMLLRLHMKKASKETIDGLLCLFVYETCPRHPELTPWPNYFQDTIINLKAQAPSNKSSLPHKEVSYRILKRKRNRTWGELHDCLITKVAEVFLGGVWAQRCSTRTWQTFWLKTTVSITIIRQFAATGKRISLSARKTKAPTKSSQRRSQTFSSKYLMTSIQFLSRSWWRSCPPRNWPKIASYSLNNNESYLSFRRKRFRAGRRISVKQWSNTLKKSKTKMMNSARTTSHSSKAPWCTL